MSLDHGIKQLFEELQHNGTFQRTLSVAMDRIVNPKCEECGCALDKPQRFCNICHTEMLTQFKSATERYEQIKQNERRRKYHKISFPGK